MKTKIDWELDNQIVSMPAIGATVTRTVGKGFQRGVVTSHRGNRIAVEFPNGDLD